MSEKTERMDEIKAKMKDVEFKKEGLGALEFKYNIVDKDFNEKEVEFRIERTSLQTYAKARQGKTGDKLFENMIKNFIALPREASEIKYFEMSTGALEEIVEICNDFQQFPLSFQRSDK